MLLQLGFKRSGDWHSEMVYFIFSYDVDQFDPFNQFRLGIGFGAKVFFFFFLLGLKYFSEVITFIILCYGHLGKNVICFKWSLLCWMITAAAQLSFKCGLCSSDSFCK